MIRMKEKYDENIDEILEKASDLCHEEWMDWTKTISVDLNKILGVLIRNKEYLKNNEDIDKEDLINKNDELITMIEDRLDRWQSYWIDYSELSDEVKEYDRIYARKILDLTKDK